MKKVTFSLLALMAITLTVASAFTSAPKATSTYNFVDLHSYSGSLTDPSAVNNNPKIGAVNRTSQPVAAEINAKCESGSPLCAGTVRLQDGTPAQVIATYNGVFVP